MITGERSRYNDGFGGPEPFGKWLPVSPEYGREMLDDCAALDRRKQRAYQAAALSAGIESENDGTGYEME